MNPQEIKEFLKSIKHTDIEEMQYHNGSDSLYFKKSEVEHIAIPDVPLKESVVEDKKALKKDSLVSIKSTIVGTFLSTPGGDKPPFVKEGDNIVVGQTIGQIEAMKIIKDVKAKIKGKVIKIFVSNSQAVEYGQELFLIDTSK
jgi:acetyl-CoA carboxylase biotin carboxyl carrier protein